MYIFEIMHSCDKKEDDKIVALIRQKNPSGVRLLYDIYGGAIYGVILRLVKKGNGFVYQQWLLQLIPVNYYFTFREVLNAYFFNLSNIIFNGIKKYDVFIAIGIYSHLNKCAHSKRFYNLCHKILGSSQLSIKIPHLEVLRSII